VATAPSAVVQFPGDPADPLGKDVASPVAGLLNQLNLLGTRPDYLKDDGLQGVFTTPAPSVAVIEQGATAITKLWSALLAAGITATGIVAVVQGIWGNGHDSVRIAIIGGSALVLAALSIAIALIVSNDVRSRADGAVSTIQARTAVASTFMTLTRNPQAPVAASFNGQMSIGKNPPLLTNLIAVNLVVQTVDAPGVSQNAIAIGLDHNGKRWYLAVRQGQPPQVIPEEQIAIAKPAVP
jgi:hypothetical protein